METKFTFHEFIRCVKAWLAFGGGYKLGERYKLGELEAKLTKSLDSEAWQLGYDLSTKRYMEQHPPQGGIPIRPYKSGAIIGSDGLTDAQRRIDPEPTHWSHDAFKGSAVDDDHPDRT